MIKSYDKYYLGKHKLTNKSWKAKKWQWTAKITGKQNFQFFEDLKKKLEDLFDFV